MSDEWSFDAVDAIFAAISDGGKRIYVQEFERFFAKGVAPHSPRQRTKTDRSHNKALIVSPGFGLQANPAQAQAIEQACYQTRYVHVPNPETPDFSVVQYLEQLKAEIDEFQPDIVVCGSKGGVYAVGLWQIGYWRGPTLLINAHPSCKRLPEDVRVVLAHGANDEVYPRVRAELEQLVATGTPNLCFLYYTANSGQLSNGQLSRVGDMHNMASLVSYDCLPRLMDAALSDEAPEVHMVRTWKGRLTPERLEAERALGEEPHRLMFCERLKFAQFSRVRRPSMPRGDKVLFDVPVDSEEFRHISTIFKAAPREQAAYVLSQQESWDAARIVRIERVHNKPQLDNSTQPYYQSLRDSFSAQGLTLEPGTHTRWAFHGADAAAVESIVTN